MPVIRVRFAKLAPVRYISHLDLMRTLERAMRRAKVPMALSEGYHPRPIFSLASALPVGITSEAEYGDFHLSSDWSPEEFCRRVNCELPAGIRFLEAVVVPDSAPKLMAVVDRASYVCTPMAVLGSDGPEPLPEDLGEVLMRESERLMHESTILVERTRKGEAKVVDLRPLVYGIAVSIFAKPQVELDVASGSRGNVRPEEILNLFSRQLIWQVHRTGLYVTREGTRTSPMEVEV